MARNTNRYDAMAGMQFRDLGKTGPNNYGNAQVVDTMAQHGVGAMLISDRDAYDETASHVWASEAMIAHQDDEPVLAAGKISNLEIGTENGLHVVRARIVTPRSLEDTIPVMNGMRLREIGSSKWTQYNLVPEFMVPTRLLERDQTLDDAALDSLRGEKVVIKRDNGQLGKHIRVVPKLDARQAVDEIRKELSDKGVADNELIIQEYAPGVSFQGLAGLGEDEQQKIDALKKQDRGFEFRMYCFIDLPSKLAADERYFGVARGIDIDTGRDDWICVRQGSIPEDVLQMTDITTRRLLDAGSVEAGYFAIDLFQSQLPGDDMPRTYIREINTKDPLLVEAREHLQTALHQRKILGKTLAYTALAVADNSGKVQG